MFRRSTTVNAILATPAVGPLAVTPAIRSTLMATVINARQSLFLSGLASGFVALVAIVRLHQLWTYAWFLADVSLFVARLIIIEIYRQKNRHKPENPYKWVAWYVPFATLACLLLGIGAMCSIDSLDNPLTTLTLMVTAGVLAGIASRNAVLPRLAFLQIVLAVLPTATGAILAPGGAYWILVPPCLIFLVTMSTLVKSSYTALVSLMVAEQANAELAARFDAALRHMPHGLCTTDEQHRVIVANQKVAELFGATVQSLKLNVTLPEFIGNVSLAAFGETCRKQLIARCTTWLEKDEKSLEFKLENGTSLNMTRSQVPDGSAVIIIEDVSEQRLIESELRYLAHHDSLTGLPNRRYFYRHMGSALQHPLCVSGVRTMTVLCLDLDGFKAINDGYGHSAGDEVLQIFAARIKRDLPPSALLTRLGGDEFAIAVTDIDQSAVSALAARLVDDMAPPFSLADGTSVVLGLSIGIAAAAPKEPFNAVMGRADIALYEAKSAGKSTYRLAEEPMNA